MLAQIATHAKSNEITPVPKLLEMLSLKGTIVTVDALNRQREIAQQIVDQGGDYALALKGNQPSLHANVTTFLDDPASAVSTAKPTETTAGSRPAGPRSPPISAGCKRRITCPVWQQSARWSASARPQPGPPPRRPITCLARRSLRSGSTRSSARTGGLRTGCIGGWMW